MKLSRNRLRKMILKTINEDTSIGPDLMDSGDMGGSGLEIVKKVKSKNKSAKPKLKAQKKVQPNDTELQELQKKFNDLVSFLFNEPGGQFDQLTDIIIGIYRRLEILEKRTEFMGTSKPNFKGISPEDSAKIHKKAKEKLK